MQPLEEFCYSPTNASGSRSAYPVLDTKNLMLQKYAFVIKDPRLPTSRHRCSLCEELPMSQRVRCPLTLAICTIGIAVILASAPSAEARTLRCADGNAACVIAAIEESNASDKDTVLLLGRGVYTLDPATYPSLLPEGLTSTGKLTIKGAGADNTIIQRAAGAPPFRILTGLSRLTIESVSILGGDASDTSCACGGAIFSSGILIVSASRISMNQSSNNFPPNQFQGYGGGIAATGQLIIIDSLISQNRSAAQGGGISARSATIIGSTISANTGQDGGGIAAAILAITDSAIVSNSGRFGGGIFDGGDADYTLVNATIAENTAPFGGAIQIGVPDAPPGAVHVDGRVTITNSTISGNRAFVGAAGIGGPLGSTGDLVVSLSGTILAQNFQESSGQPRDCGGALSFTSAGHNLLGGCDIMLSDTDLTGDPRLDSLADHGTPGNAHLPLLSDSPAIDAGGTGCSPRDQINRRRVSACDIGAIEFQPPHHEHSPR
jgi:hypothetical protein